MHRLPNIRSVGFLNLSNMDKSHLSGMTSVISDIFDYDNIMQRYERRMLVVPLYEKTLTR